MRNTCLLCNSEHFNLLLHYENEKVVTSDNKIALENFELLECVECRHVQKKVDVNLLKKIENIYSDYEAYSLSEGKEEQKFDANKAEHSRSSIILENILDLVQNEGAIVDIGSGSGVFLEEFAKKFEWTLFAQDVKISKNNNLHKLKNFKKFFLLNQDNLYDAHFDIVSAIHVLEHVVDVHTFLVQAKKALKADGFLLLQVPNIHESLFDIFVIDHLSHFHKASIYALLKKYFKFVYFPKGQINREITVIATDKEREFAYDNFVQEKNFSSQKVDNMLHQLQSIDEKVALFGTSPNALFCASLLDDKVECFVDENLKKMGKKLFDKKIVHPTEISSNIKIIFPYSRDIFQNVQKRYPALNFIYIESAL